MVSWIASNPRRQIHTRFGFAERSAGCIGNTLKRCFFLLRDAKPYHMDVNLYALCFPIANECTRIGITRFNAVCDQDDFAFSALEVVDCLFEAIYAIGVLPSGSTSLKKGSIRPAASSGVLKGATNSESLQSPLLR